MKYKKQKSTSIKLYIQKLGGGGGQEKNCSFQDYIYNRKKC